MDLTPSPYDPEADFPLTEDEKRAGGRMIITAMGPRLDGYDFFADRNARFELPDIELSPTLVKLAAEFANAGEGNAYFKAHLNHLKFALGVAAAGGSALLCADFGRQAIAKAAEYPDALFSTLDADWERYVKTAQEDGLGLLVPPVLGIVLSRCAKREAIPMVIKDLRDEWAESRRKVWELLGSLRQSRTLDEAAKIRQELLAASNLFSPSQFEFASRPIRILWDILAAASAGALVAGVSGGNPTKGAVAGTITQIARSAPASLHEFGSALFGRGAFDLANKVRRAASEVEFGALRRLLADGEKKDLGLA